MNKHLQRLDMLARQAGLVGISALSFGGQFAADGKWHYTDCKVIGTSANPMGPFPSEMVIPAMVTSCCLTDTWTVIQEVSPAALGHTLNALLVIDDARQIVAMYATDFSSTPFADLAPLDAIADFSSELAELSGNVANRVLRVTHRLDAVIELASKFDEDLAALRLQRFADPEFLDDLFEAVSDELGIVRDDTPVLTSCSSFSVQYTEDPMKNYILTGLVDVFAPEAASSRCLASMPLWAYRAFAQLGGSKWLAKPYSDLEPAVEETARVLWINNPSSPMFDFDSCVLAATALCREPTTM